MAKGIRPVVHTWPGAVDQFRPEWLFNSVDDAAGQILLSPEIDDKDGMVYRDYVKERYSLDNYRRVVGMVEGI